MPDKGRISVLQLTLTIIFMRLVVSVVILVQICRSVLGHAVGTAAGLFYSCWSPWGCWQRMRRGRH